VSPPERATCELPEAAEIGADEVLVDLLHGPDALGRYQLVAYWLDDAKPTGVAAQLFFVHLEGWLASVTAKGRTVRTIDRRA
jgi:hypothetical protein